MSAVPKAAGSVALVEACVRYTPEERIRNKKLRDERRKSIRMQNVRSKSMK